MTTTEIAPALTLLARQMHTLQARFLEHLGLGMGQSLILKEILSNYGINEAQLGRLLKLDKSTVTRAVQRLVQAGYVEKKPNPADRRSHYLLSTNMARVLEPQFNLVNESLAEALLRGLKEEEIEQFGIFIRRTSANVHHVLHSPPESQFKRIIHWLNT